MSRYTWHDIGLFNTIGMAREVNEDTWMIEKGNVHLRVTARDDGTYEVFATDESYIIQVMACCIMLEDALNKALFRYQQQASTVKNALNDIYNMGDALYAYTHR